MTLPVLWIVVMLVALQRALEVAYARRNTAKLLSRGGIELGAAHYPLIVLLHAAWLASMLAFIPRNTPPNWTLIGVYAGLQALRIWTIASLGPYWTTRIVELPGVPLVRRGPYRFMRHPNYAIVVAEIAVLPLAFGAVGIAAAFTFLNASLLFWRLKVEEPALQRRR